MNNSKDFPLQAETKSNPAVRTFESVAASMPPAAQGKKK